MYNNNKIYVIGDLHGDYDIFIKCLKLAKLVDSNLHWTGDNCYLVQVGDTLDGKRPDVVMDKEFLEVSGEVEIIKLILNLDSQAKNKGGRVISLIGNHELYPYYLKDDKKFIKDYVKSKDIDMFKKQYKIDRIKFLQPGNIGGSLIGRTRPLILQLGEFLFVHGSITNSLIMNNLNSEGKVDIAKINKATSLWLQGKGKIPRYLEDMDEENPVFSRIHSNKKQFTEGECKKIEEQLHYFDGVKYIVMGHSRYKTINSTCKNKLIRTDVSLSRAFGGKLANKNIQILEIKQYSDRSPDINILSDNGLVKI